MSEPLKILITGASGFIGSFLCEEGLKRGMNVWAGMRKSSGRKWLQNEWLQFAWLDMENPDTLHRQLSDLKQKIGRWDYVVHAAGATKCLHEADFDRANYDCTVNLVHALRELDMTPRLFIYMSSLSVLGPVREPLHGTATTDYEPLRDTDTPRPNTAYGRSKLKSEAWIQALSPTDFPFVILRLTGVYGPRERDYFLQAQSISRHIDFAVGFQPQVITFVYVADVVGTVYAAIRRTEEGKLERIVGRIYHVSDGQEYSSRAFSDYIQRDLGIRSVVHIKAPLWLLRAVCNVSERWARMRGKASTLNHDKYNILCQRNWKCDIRPLLERLEYTPEWNLERGTKETIDWYRRQGWL